MRLPLWMRVVLNLLIYVAEGLRLARGWLKPSPVRTAEIVVAEHYVCAKVLEVFPDGRWLVKYDDPRCHQLRVRPYSPNEYERATLTEA